MKSSIFCLFISILFIAQASAQNISPKHDLQIWNETQISIPLIKSRDKKTERVSLILYGTLRFGRNVKHFVDERIGIGLDFKINKYLSFTPSYIYRADQPFQGRKEYENRLRLDINLEKKFKYFTLKNRNRVEFRFLNSRSDSTRYRNKIQITIPVKRNGKEIFAPFVADEPYYEFQTRKWTRNEFSAGISKKFTPNFSADFFYLLQNNRGNSFKYVNAFGINLKIKID